ncbi:hypothetical protein JTB14_014749 [Gonioctena quinquepunctata]|nr:hypothetical protein JTB14_014749 [Gonioctena quinquepunctata]
MNLNNIVVQGKIEQFIFDNRNQGVDEPFDPFSSDLKRIIQSSECNRQKDSILVDRIILETSDSKVREKLLNISNVTLKEAAEVCRNSEATKKHLGTVRNKDKVSTDDIRKDNNYQVANYGGKGTITEQLEETSNVKDALRFINMRNVQLLEKNVICVERTTTPAPHVA